MSNNTQQSITISSLQHQIDLLNQALLNRPTIDQFNSAMDISIGQFGNNTELVTDTRMKAIERQFTVVLEEMRALSTLVSQMRSEIDDLNV